MIGRSKKHLISYRHVRGSTGAAAETAVFTYCSNCITIINIQSLLYLCSVNALCTTHADVAHTIRWLTLYRAKGVAHTIR